MEIANKSLLKPVVGELNRYTTKDKKYTITVVTITIRRFGPSGSLKNRNITLEHTIAVTNRIMSEILFDLRYIAVIYIKFNSERILKVMCCQTWSLKAYCFSTGYLYFSPSIHKILCNLLKLFPKQFQPR